MNTYTAAAATLAGLVIGVALITFIVGVKFRAPIAFTISFWVALVGFGLFTLASVLNIHDQGTATLAVISASILLAVTGTTIMRRRDARAKKAARSR